MKPYFETENGALYCGDCVDVMRGMAQESVDLTVTSPPYDNLREYKGFVFDFESVAQGLYRVTKPGGVVVWVVADATINGSETGSSFRQALYFKEIEFNLHDTMIYQKTNISFPESNRYYSAFEFMFIFSKGKVRAFNPIKKKNPNAGRRITSLKRGKNGILQKDSGYLNNKVCPEESVINNIWPYSTGTNSAKDAFGKKHPAIFPEALARDHIISWSNPGDTVFDPFSGSGTTWKMAHETGRRFIGAEISPEYCEIIKDRITAATAQLKLFA